MQQRVVFLDRLFDRAAILVAEHHQKPHAEHIHRVFQRGDHGVVDDLPGSAHGEQIADARVEDDVGADARIGAAEHRGIRLMRVDDRLARLRAAVRMFRLAFGESAIARQHAAPHATCGAFHVVLVHKCFIRHRFHPFVVPSQAMVHHKRCSRSSFRSMHCPVCLAWLFVFS